MKVREIEMIKEAAGMKREGFDDEAAPAPANSPEAKAEPEPAADKKPAAEDKQRRIRVRL